MPTTKYYQLHKSVSRDFIWGKLDSFFVPRFFYEILYFPLEFIFKLFFSFEVETKENLKKLKGPLIVVCSHASWVDPFLVSIAFPVSSKTAPIHYATWWKYYYFPPFTLLLWLFGGFPVRKGVGLQKALMVGSEILEKGGVVGIFPTGKRTRKWNEHHLPKGRRGAAFLAVKNKAPVLPVKIEGNIGMRFGGFLRKKYKIKVKIGRAFSLAGKGLFSPENLNRPSDLIMKKINEL
jgi:1-acyl-sn-glycerol-3-phosphate acyltransferase